MDYQQLLKFAEKRDQNGLNKKNSGTNKNGTSGPDPSAVAKFLAKKRSDQIKRAEEERIKKERLLALRNQNTKSAKAAKMMACKTKDNDFSKIILSEREMQDKNMIESQLKRKQIHDPLERMKERIEKEQELELLSKGKRRRKSGIAGDSQAAVSKNPDRFDYNYNEIKKQKDELIKKSKSNHSAINESKKQPKNNLSFEELLKIAEQKQKEIPKKSLQQEYEEELIAKRKAKEQAEREEMRKREQYYTERSLKKSSRNCDSNSRIAAPCDKSRKVFTTTLYERPTSSITSHDSQQSRFTKSSEDARSVAKQRNIELLKQQQSSYKSKESVYDRPSSQAAKNKPASADKYRSVPKVEKDISTRNKPQNLSLIDIFKESSDPQTLSSKISNLSADQFKQLHQAIASTIQNGDKEANSKKSHKTKSSYKSSESSAGHSSRFSDEYRSSKHYGSSPKRDAYDVEEQKSKKLSKSYENSSTSVAGSSKKSKTGGRMLIDLDNCDPEELERIKKEIEQRKKAAEQSAKPKSSLDSSTASNTKMCNGNKNVFKNPLARRSPSPQYSHMGRYLPPIGATYKRGNYSRLAYDDYDEEEEDDDMDSFIDDGDDHEQQKNDVSSYIREIFGYDKRKYMYESDEDIEEASYAQQMKEEARSARLGLKEDLEDIRREEEEMKRKAKKKRRYIIDSDDE